MPFRVYINNVGFVARPCVTPVMSQISMDPVISNGVSSLHECGLDVTGTRSNFLKYAAACWEIILTHKIMTKFVAVERK